MSDLRERLVLDDLLSEIEHVKFNNDGQTIMANLALTYIPMLCEVIVELQDKGDTQAKLLEDMNAEFDLETAWAKHYLEEVQATKKLLNEVREIAEYVAYALVNGIDPDEYVLGKMKERANEWLRKVK